MENFNENIAEFLEVDEIRENDELNSFDAWDSLTILSIISFCLDEYDIPLSADEISDCITIQDLKNLVKNKL